MICGKASKYLCYVCDKLYCGDHAKERQGMVICLDCELSAPTSILWRITPISQAYIVITDESWKVLDWKPNIDFAEDFVKFMMVKYPKIDKFKVCLLIELKEASRVEE